MMGTGGMASRLEAVWDLIRKYFMVLGAAWGDRRSHETPRRKEYELKFLPAVLELAETPVHPAPYWTMVTITLLLLVAMLLAIFGHLDIVVMAKGKVLPDDRVKIIQPAVTGVVRRILVQDGQLVTQGQVLMELDPIQAEADAAKARTVRVGAALSAARARALLEATNHNRVPSVASDNDVTPAERNSTEQAASAAYKEYTDKMSAARAELSKREAELETTRHEIESLRQTAPLARQEADDYKLLSAKKYVSTHEYLEKEQTAIQQEQDLLSKQSHARELMAAIDEQRAVVSQTRSEFQREQFSEYEKSALEVKQDMDDESKASSRAQLMRIAAPVAGTVQHLSVHTVGGVVTTAQNIMTVVPNEALEVEAEVENKDIGFVEVGQAAVVKVETFPYTRFGFLTGIVRSVANDAAQDSKHDLKFMTRVRLDSNRMRVHDRYVSLVPGMAVSVEIRTGRRTVLEFFLDPLVQTLRNSLHER